MLAFSTRQSTGPNSCASRRGSPSSKRTRCGFPIDTGQAGALGRERRAPGAQVEQHEVVTETVNLCKTHRGKCNPSEDGCLTVLRTRVSTHKAVSRTCPDCHNSYDDDVLHCPEDGRGLGDV